MVKGGSGGVGRKYRASRALVRDIEIRVQYILALKAITIPGRTDKISSSQMKLGRLAMSTGGPPLTRFSLLQIPLLRFLAYVRASGGFSR